MNILKQIWHTWRAFGKALADIVGRVVMVIFYFTIALPFGLGVRFFSDPLKLKPRTPQWEPRESKQPTVEEARRAF